MPAGAKPGHSVSPETRAKISAALKGRKSPKPWLVGRKQSPELIEKRIAPLRTSPPFCTIDGCDKKTNARGWCAMHYMRWRTNGDPLVVGPPALSGAANPNWKGNEIGYDAAHIRAKNIAPRVCRTCGATDGRLELALLHTAPPENLRESQHGPFSIDVADYVRMCVRCHRRYDSPRADTRAEIEALLLPNDPT